MDHPRQEKRRRITPSPPAAGAALPDDLLFMEVLARLPVKCLMRFKSVCRSWRARMEEADFVRRHGDFSRAGPPSMIVIACKNASEYEGGGELPEMTFYRLRPGQAPGDFEANAEVLLEKAACPPESGGIADVVFPTHCDGLIAFATAATDRVFVCNPATKELVPLPLGSPDVNWVESPSAAIGFDRWRSRYVVARYFYRRWCYDESSGELDYDIGHEVFTLGGDSWELTADPPHAIGGTQPVCTGDAFYWACDTAEHPPPSSLLRFSLRDRTFDLEVPCPPGFGYHSSPDHLAELDGKLCYVNNGVSLMAFDVWQLADDGDETRPARWSLRCRIDPGLAYDQDFDSYDFMPIWAAGGGMLVMVSDGDDKLYWCSEKSRGVKKVVDLEEDVDLEEGNYIHHVVPYRESLVSITKCN